MWSGVPSTVDSCGGFSLGSGGTRVRTKKLTAASGVLALVSLVRVRLEATADWMGLEDAQNGEPLARQRHSTRQSSSLQDWVGVSDRRALVAPSPSAFCSLLSALFLLAARSFITPFAVKLTWSPASALSVGTMGPARLLRTRSESS